ncbi:transglutaminase-like domain-containing protein [Ramlibacter humi]|uniref:transglutaminase-like domain-containing protein n=1 Tax=Ramlibacter humi TaxID=2530451 RepID=UPI001430E4FF|nr:transglutaminase-like domain-containing protein [Ramlibacter humi]
MSDLPEPGAPPPPGPDDPRRWLGATALLDLEDPRLRVRARSLTQLCKTEREKVLSVYAFVKRLPFTKPLKLQPRTARQVLDAGRGDSPDKATLLVALLRSAGIPARLHWYEFNGEVMRGLVPSLSSGGRPAVEVWAQGRWVGTDTYIFDAAYMAAARQRLKDLGWTWGYGIHREGHAIWNGLDGAWVGGSPPAEDPMVLEDHGCYDDVLAFSASEAYRKRRRPLTRSLHWNMVAPLMERAIRELRAGDGPASPPQAERETS